MTSIAETIDVADINDIAAYFSSQKRKAGSHENVGASAGRRLYMQGIKRKGVDACADCHGDNGMGNIFAQYPLIAGQHSDYIVTTLKRFRSGKRNNDLSNIMQDIAEKLSDEEITLLASYIMNLK